MRRLALVAAFAGVSLAARGLAALLGAFDGDVRDEILLNAGGSRIAASVYAPRLPGEATATGRGRRAVVLCHGISASRRHMDPLARELARHGFLVVSFDFGAHGDSEDRPVVEEQNVLDVKAAITLARREGATGPVALVGHSMGVLSAVRLGAEDPGVGCVVALGQRPSPVPQDRPRALLVAAGAMDPFHPPSSLLEAARSATGRDLEAFEPAVDPRSGAVRLVFFSGACEHAGEVYDGKILGETVAFIEAALGPAGAVTPARASVAIRPPLGVSCRFVSATAAAVALVLIGLGLGLGAPPGRASQTTSFLGKRLVASALVGLALAPLLLARAKLASLETARSFTPPLLLGAMVAGALLAARSAGRRTPPAVALATAACVAAAWIGGTLLGAVPAFARHPELLWDLPVYFWQGIAFRVQFTIDGLASILIQSPLAGEPHGSIVLYGLVALEVLLPGRAVGLAAWLAVRLFRGLGGKVPGDPPGVVVPAAEPVSSKKLAAVLMVLVLVALGIFAKRASEGLLSEEGALTTVLATGLRLFVLPLLAMTASVWAIRLAPRARALFTT